MASKTAANATVKPTGQWKWGSDARHLNEKLHLVCCISYCLHSHLQGAHSVISGPKALINRLLKLIVCKITISQDHSRIIAISFKARVVF